MVWLRAPHSQMQHPHPQRCPQIRVSEPRRLLLHRGWCWAGTGDPGLLVFVSSVLPEQACSTPGDFQNTGNSVGSNTAGDVLVDRYLL